MKHVAPKTSCIKNTHFLGKGDRFGIQQFRNTGEKIYFLTSIVQRPLSNSTPPPHNPVQFQPDIPPILFSWGGGGGWKFIVSLLRILACIHLSNNYYTRYYANAWCWISCKIQYSGWPKIWQDLMLGYESFHMGLKTSEFCFGWFYAKMAVKFANEFCNIYSESRKKIIWEQNAFNKSCNKWSKLLFQVFVLWTKSEKWEC